MFLWISLDDEFRSRNSHNVIFFCLIENCYAGDFSLANPFLLLAASKLSSFGEHGPWFVKRKMVSIEEIII